MKPIRLLLADDHALVRAGIAALIRGHPEFQVVAEAANGHEALRLIADQQPDVALLDIAMPGLNGLEVAARVAREWPFVRVIILSMHATEEYVLHALRMGAAGYLLKDASPAELELALQTVAQGDTYLCPAVSKHVAEYVRRSGAEPGAGAEQSPWERLTPRQREVWQLVAEGYTTKEIARKLKIGIKTVETHRMALMKRLGVRDLTSLVRYAIRIGLVRAEE